MSDPSSYPGMSAAFSPDGRMLATENDGGTAYRPRLTGGCLARTGLATEAW